jgi:ABC-type transport system substrate-binding protein
VEGGGDRDQSAAEGVRRFHIVHHLRALRPEAGTLFGSWTDPKSYLVRYHMPGQITNASGVNDPKVTEMIQLQRRTFDVAKRREIIYDIQRHLSQHVYHLYGPSSIAVAV